MFPDSGRRWDDLAAQLEPLGVVVTLSLKVEQGSDVRTRALERPEAPRPGHRPRPPRRCRARARNRAQPWRTIAWSSTSITGPGPGQAQATPTVLPTGTSTRSFTPPPGRRSNQPARLGDAPLGDPGQPEVIAVRTEMKSWCAWSLRWLPEPSSADPDSDTTGVRQRSASHAWCASAMNRPPRQCLAGDLDQRVLGPAGTGWVCP